MNVNCILHVYSNSLPAETLGMVYVVSRYSEWAVLGSLGMTGIWDTVDPGAWINATLAVMVTNGLY